MERTKMYGALLFLLSFVIRVLRIIITIKCERKYNLQEDIYKNLELIITND